MIGGQAVVGLQIMPHCLAQILHEREGEKERERREEREMSSDR